jgi:hypothetical protein
MTYKFVDYYKYRFRLQLENGDCIVNESQTGEDTYRLGIEVTGEAVPLEDGNYLVDGYLFIKE